MIKATFSFIFIFFFVINSSSFANPTLKSFNIIRISSSVENLIFTFDKISSYRFIKLSDDYWYVAFNNSVINIKTALTPSYSIKGIYPKIIRNETRIYIRMKKAKKYKFRIILSKNKKFFIVRIEEPVLHKTRNTHSVKTKIKKPIIKHRHIPIIVIDPGHGGKDPGAIGIYDKEKTVVLDIGKRVAYYLKRKGYKVFLTRNSDTYPTLTQRALLANNKNADIFVSIHANYAPKNRYKAKGLEVYFLNTTSDKRAISLAARENSMTPSQVSDINKIILSLIQTSKIEKSKVLASIVLKDVAKEGRKIYTHYKIRKVKQAPFFVLVDTRCPSILIETAFINNPYDAKYLHKRAFRSKVALGISEGITSYLRKYK